MSYQPSQRALDFMRCTLPEQRRYFRVHLPIQAKVTFRDAGWEPQLAVLRDINILAESLKRRIDPNDLYNITIRPAGGEGRIEIILPTGGTHRTEKAEENWRTLLAFKLKD